MATPRRSSLKAALTRLRLPPARDWLSDDADRARSETVLASARLYMSVLGLFAVIIDREEPSGSASVAYSLLVAYSLWCALVFVVSWRTSGLPVRTVLWLQVSDIAWPAFLTTFTAGPNSPLFPFMVFPTIAAAYRWGVRKAMAVSVVVSLLIFTQYQAWNYLTWVPGDSPLNRMIIRASNLFIIGLLVGILADSEKQRRLEATTLARLLARGGRETGIRTSMGMALREIAHLFGAARVGLLVRESQEAPVAVWQVGRGTRALQFTQASAGDCDPVFSGQMPDGMFLRIRSSERALMVTLDAAGRPVVAPDVPAFEKLGVFRAHRQSLSAAYDGGGDLAARLIVFDPVVHDAAADIRFLQTLVQNAGPGLHHLYLRARLRRQMSGVERARVARELHDGVIQSLSAVEMRLAYMRRTIDAGEPFAAQLKVVQDLVHEETIALRDLMQYMRPLDLDQKDFIEFAADVAARFRGDTGIEATVQTDVTELVLPSREGRALGRILQEALRNVRRHSHARTVVVRIRLENGLLSLTIDDDGDGFAAFTGRLEGVELDRSLRAPLSIKEHAHAIGAALAIESTPGTGSRIEVTLALDRPTLRRQNDQDSASVVEEKLV